MKFLSILGSTGSIGTQALDLVRQFPLEFKVVGLTANKNYRLLLSQIKEFKPGAAAIMDGARVDELLNFCSARIYSGIEGLNRIATLREADTVVNALVGSVGIEPTYNAIKNKKKIALANKETLVAAGSIIMEEAKKSKVGIMPIDSEHSAIFQCIQGENIKDLSRITLTCSGGPFRNKAIGELKNMSPGDALKHPTWKMGDKITIDSATLMNKGFEVIEAHWLYGIGYDKIDILIHPQSIVHSMVEFVDKSVIAQLVLPDMKIPIQYALSHPKRFRSMQPSANLARISRLDFSEPDFDKFPCLKYAYEAGNVGGTMPAAMNAANEAAVHAFLENKIIFTDIQKIIRSEMDAHKVVKNPSLSEILLVDKKIKEEVIKKL